MTTDPHSRPTGSLRVACPFCGAKPGRSCETRDTRIPIDNVHPSRSEAMVAALVSRGNVNAAA